LALQVWNLLGGIDWSGLPLAAEMFGIEDVEQLVRDLVTVRDFQRAKD
jgi:hypothetical protein